MITAEQIQQLLNAQNNNDFIRVAKIANELLQIAPENDFLLQAKATALFNQANYFDAIQTIKTALQIYPKNNQLLNSFASMLKILTQNVNNIFDDNLLLFLAQTCKDLSFFASAVIFYRQLYNKNQNQKILNFCLIIFIVCNKAAMPKSLTIWFNKRRVRNLQKLQFIFCSTIIAVS